MKPALRLHLQAAAAIVVPAALALPSTSAAAQLPAGAIRAVATDRSPDTAQALRVVLGLSLLAILPALLVCVTSFLRVIIVLSMLRHAIGMPETPPNPVLIGLAVYAAAATGAAVWGWLAPR